MSSGRTCCDQLAEAVRFDCPDHDDPSDCPDVVILRRPGGTWVLPVHDGGTSGIAISFCPFCGSALEG